MSLRDKYCIIGVGTTKFGKLPGVSTYQMNLEAIKRALADAGIDKKEVDGVLCKYPTSHHESMYSLKIAQLLGIEPKVTGVIDQGGATNINLTHYAMACIDAGMCSTVVISSADNPLTGSRHVYSTPLGDDAVYGFFGTPGAYATIARRHMHDYGTTSEQLGAISVACRKHGALNPNAQVQKAIILEDHQKSRYIVEPLRLLDCCLVSDGAAAIIVTSVEKAKALGIKPIYIMGVGQGNPAWDVAYRREITLSGAEHSGKVAFKMAGIEPKDVDFAQIYDCFTITALITLEEYGFCKKGEGGSFVEGGRIELGGELPINTSGGLLSETGMPGMQLIVEAVRQLRGECGPRQVNDAEIGIVSNQGGVMSTHSTLILRR